MRNALKLILVPLFVLSVGCGKTPQQKAEESINDQKALVAEINAMGVPSSSWSDDALNQYEAKLKRLEDVEARLGEMNGKDGVTIVGSNNSRAISTLRGALNAARAEKAAAQAREASRSKTSVSIEVDKGAARIIKMQEDLTPYAERIAAHYRSGRAGHPGADIKKALPMTDQLISACEQQIKLIDDNRSQLDANTLEGREFIVGLLKTTKNFRDALVEMAKELKLDGVVKPVELKRQEGQSA